MFNNHLLSHDNDPNHPSHFDADLTKWYKRFQKEIAPSLYHDAYGIHGVNHIERVLKLTLTLINHMSKDKFSLNDILIIGLSASYHDIGRTHDGIDFEHGFESVVKLKKLGLVEKFLDCYALADEFNANKDNLQILHFIIAHHNTGDRYAQSVLKENNKIKDKIRAWFLYSILCDSDNLDRVRIGDLDTNYLRLGESLELVDYANYLLYNMELRVEKN